MLRAHKHKFGAKRTKRGDKSFPSRLEARCFDVLTQLKNSGKVLFFLSQVPISIPTGSHRVDFLVFCDDGDALFIEAKGRDLEAGKMRRELAEIEIGCQINVVTDPKQIYVLINSLFPKEKVLD